MQTYRSLFFSFFFISVFLIICTLLSSCNQNTVMESQQNFANNKWDYSDAKTFTAEIKDTVQHYNIYISLRHQFNFEWRNIWIKIETTFPDGKQYEKRINLTLSKPDGEWFGDVLGDNCDIQVPIQMNAYFPELGKYTFKLSQDMRVNPLGYIKTVGMRIEKSKKEVK